MAELKDQSLFLGMAELAKILGYPGKKGYSRALTFCRNLEKRKGKTLLIKFGGTTRTGKWLISREILNDFFTNPLEPSNERLEKVEEKVADLLQRVAELEDKVFDLTTAD